MYKLNKKKWRTNVCVRILKIILPATMLISATTARAEVCSPDVSSSLKQAQFKVMLPTY
ncbi:hypothetical protein [Enterobacter hormaechei]|uniref:hypothetical protein n=1 Tax=Enterobacter hormaechei TaxID=158836 RepID=UPI0013C33823|nr:hypothetical protein [Enterobacter hormaechei]